MKERYDRVGRNDPCPCGSGKKYKRCHGGPASSTLPSGSALQTAIRSQFLSNLGLVWVAPDVFQGTLTWEQAKALLSAMDWKSAVLSMAMLNAVCAELALGDNPRDAEGFEKIGDLGSLPFPK